MLLIAWGLKELAPIWDEPNYRRTMSLCFVASLMALLQSVLDHLILPWPPGLGLVSTLFCLVCIYSYCAAMRTFCWLGQFDEAERSWALSQRLFLVLNLLPSIAMNLVGLLLFLSGARSSLDLGIFGTALLASVVSLIHILMSISRMRRVLLLA